jgi:hypothetical protein
MLVVQWFNRSKVQGLGSNFGRLLKKDITCFDKDVLSVVEGLSMNGNFLVISNLSPFVLSPVEG